MPQCKINISSTFFMLYKFIIISNLKCERKRSGRRGGRISILIGVEQIIGKLIIWYSLLYGIYFCMILAYRNKFHVSKDLKEIFSEDVIRKNSVFGIFNKKVITYKFLRMHFRTQIWARSENLKNYHIIIIIILICIKKV